MSDELSWSFSVAASHYLGAADAPELYITRFGAGTSWTLSDRLTLDLAGLLVPSYGGTTAFADGTREISRNFARGASIDASYEFAPDAEDFDAELDLGGGVTEYVATTLDEGRGIKTQHTAATVLQTHLSAALELTLAQDNQLTFTGAYYVYNQNTPGQSSLGLADAVPIEPFRYNVRLDLARKLGSLRLSAYGQTGSYAEHAGSSLLVGGRIAFVLATSARLYLSCSFQRMAYNGFAPLYSQNLGVGMRVLF